MIVIIHQAKGMQLPPIGLHRSPQPVEALQPILVVPDDPLATIPSGHDMVQRARVLDPQGSGHVETLPSPVRPRKH